MGAIEVRSPLDGVILEKNIALGDLVDTNLDLFKIADLSRLRVMAHAYEEDLPLLDALAEASGTGRFRAERRGDCRRCRPIRPDRPNHRSRTSTRRW